DYLVLFFFSSRRRHTRSKRDWSSDVCSSDLSEVGNLLNWEFDQDQELKVVVSDLTYVHVAQKWHYIFLVDLYNREIIFLVFLCQIGRASCRERVYMSVGDVWVIVK